MSSKRRRAEIRDLKDKIAKDKIGLINWFPILTEESNLGPDDLAYKAMPKAKPPLKKRPSLFFWRRKE